MTYSLLILVSPSVSLIRISAAGEAFSSPMILSEQDTRRIAVLAPVPPNRLFDAAIVPVVTLLNCSAGFWKPRPEVVRSLPVSVQAALPVHKIAVERFFALQF